MKITINTDGGARGNPGPAASAFVAKDSAGIVLLKRGKYLGETTNNQAEYGGVILALEWAKESFSRGELEIEFLLDSNLVVNQLNGTFKIKDSGLKEKYLIIKTLEAEISDKITYAYVPREKNFEADKIVNETLDKQVSQTA